MVAPGKPYQAGTAALTMNQRYPSFADSAERLVVTAAGLCRCQCSGHGLQDGAVPVRGGV